MRSRRLSPVFPALGLALLFGLAGCATGGSGGANVYRKDLGKVMVVPLQTAREKVFGKHQISMLREEDTARNIYWESQWMPREVAPEESAEGVSAARNRVIIRGTYAEERIDGTVVLRVRLEVENQIQTALEPDWHPGPVPAMVEERFSQVYDDLMLELRAGIIR